MDRTPRTMTMTIRQRALVRAALLVAYDVGAQDREDVDSQKVEDQEVGDLLRMVRD